MNVSTNEAWMQIAEAESSRLAWPKRIDPATKQEFLVISQIARFGTNELAQDLGEPVTRILFVVTGAFRVQLMDAFGNETFQGIIGRGSAIGLLGIAVGEASKIRAEAIEPSVALSLTLDQILDLGSKSTEFQRAVLELSASLFVRVSAAERKLAIPSVVAIVHLSAKTSRLTAMLANRLLDKDLFQ